MKKLLYLFVFLSCSCYAQEPFRDYVNETHDQYFKRMMLHHLDNLDKAILKNQESLPSEDRMMMVFDVHKSREIFNYFILRYVEPFDPQNELN